MFNQGVIFTEKGSMLDYLLSVSVKNKNKISAELWAYRNRKRMHVSVRDMFRLSEAGRKILRKYKIKN